MEFTKNKYVRRAKISEYKFRKMVRYFAEDLSATQIALKTAINRNTVNRYLNEIRERIVEFSEQYAPFVEEMAEERELFFDSVPDEHNEPEKINNLGTKLANNLGILKRRGKVYVDMLANCTAAKLRSILQGKSTEEVTVHAVEVKSEDGFVAVGYDHDKSYANKPSYVENLDNFWQFVKDRTGKFQGLAKHKAYLHLKESEFRFNFRNDNLYEVMLKLILAKPIS
ncbi:MAG: IS1595 family transposase [Neisseriaceae bacterium]|nr:MAG: IS1595 family transposase [Neisseriaceae bacterium]